MSTANQAIITAPYASWTMFESTLERMRQEHIPARVDRSFLHSASGSARAQLIGTLRAFRLIDDELRPTPLLGRLVNEPDNRSEIMRQIAQETYAPLLALDHNATQGQLEEAFRNEYGIQGSTIKKAVSFFLQVAKVAGIELSPLYQTTRTPSGSSAARRRRPNRSRPAAEDTVPTIGDPMTSLRTRYVETLLDKFANANGDVDADLADRIERLIGFSSTEPEV